MWLEEDHLGTRQTQDYRVTSTTGEAVIDSHQLEGDIKKIAFDSRFFFKHNYREGDMVLVNNYTVLHGREAFSGSRELWRIQAVPPTKNMPQYFQDKGKLIG